MGIKITDFALRHFEKTFGGTKILDKTPEEFENHISLFSEQICQIIKDKNCGPKPWESLSGSIVLDGYAPFCKLVFVKNFTDARLGSTPITLENYQYIRSGYSARRDLELPVLSRWLELPLGKPKAKWLMLILYSKEQIDKEAKIEYDKRMDSGLMIFEEDFIEFKAEWGIVSINGQSHSEEEPMAPATIIRNALGMEQGGSGEPLNKEDYMKSIEFWNNNIILK